MIITANRFYFLAVLLAICCPSLIAQTGISGVINQYSPVAAVDPVGSSVTVADPGLFAVGSQVLLIQMQGAVIEDENSAAFGDVVAYGGAGGYELGVVCKVDGNIISLENELANTDYDPAGGLQLITVPEYQDALVDAELTGQAWDGVSGGVLAFSVVDNLVVAAPVNMDGKGFRGGAFENNASNCNFLIQVNDYFYAAPLDGGGRKGESIAPYTVGREYGRGAQAAGGGGGNDHNSGGGGGANAGAGGAGGENISTAFLNCDGNFPGVGGKAPALTPNRFFMGSGGGAGDGNNLRGTSGGNGGGIIIILAEDLAIVGNQVTISANGSAAENSIGGDGGGGGGAGGSIFVSAATVNGVPVLSATGGDGGDVDNEDNNRCFGPGGGGGGGLIHTDFEGSLLVDGGGSGESLNSANVGCSGANGAEPGEDGLVRNETIPVGDQPSACQSLPVSWRTIELYQHAKSNQLEWSVTDQVNNAYFTVERSADGADFLDLVRVPATAANDYTFTDFEPLSGHSFYRVRQRDFDGRATLSPTVSGYRTRSDIRLYPNMIRAGEPVKLELPEAVAEGAVSIDLIDQHGRSVRRKTVDAAQPVPPLETFDLPAGVYLVSLRSEQLVWTGRLVVQR